MASFDLPEYFGAVVKKDGTIHKYFTGGTQMNLESVPDVTVAVSSTNAGAAATSILDQLKGTQLSKHQDYLVNLVKVALQPGKIDGYDTMGSPGKMQAIADFVENNYKDELPQGANLRDDINELIRIKAIEPILGGRRRRSSKNKKGSKRKGGKRNSRSKRSRSMKKRA